jgi:hypothetical protein
MSSEQGASGATSSSAQAVFGLCGHVNTRVGRGSGTVVQQVLQMLYGCWECAFSAAHGLALLQQRCCNGAHHRACDQASGDRETVSPYYAGWSSCSWSCPAWLAVACCGSCAACGNSKCCRCCVCSKQAAHATAGQNRVIVNNNPDALPFAVAYGIHTHVVIVLMFVAVMMQQAGVQGACTDVHIYTAFGTCSCSRDVGGVSKQPSACT